MNPNEPVKLIELRNYLLKPNMRGHFIDYFENHFVESQNALGGFVLGAFRIRQENDRFFWIRGFSEMNSRSRFLPSFYGGEIWKQFGPEANEMMSEWHNVHLLKPLEEVKAKDFFTEKGLTVIDFYLAEDNKLAELADLFKAAERFSGMTLWVSEMSENDFPVLPVIQDENLLAAIANYEDEAEYESKKEVLEKDFEKLIKNHERLILFKAF